MTIYKNTKITATFNGAPFDGGVTVKIRGAFDGALAEAVKSMGSVAVLPAGTEIEYIEPKPPHGENVVIGSTWRHDRIGTYFITGFREGAYGRHFAMGRDEREASHDSICDVDHLGRGNYAWSYPSEWTLVSNPPAVALVHAENRHDRRRNGAEHPRVRVGQVWRNVATCTLFTVNRISVGEISSVAYSGAADLGDMDIDKTGRPAPSSRWEFVSDVAKAPLPKVEIGQVWRYKPTGKVATCSGFYTDDHGAHQARMGDVMTMAVDFGTRPRFPDDWELMSEGTTEPDRRVKVGQRWRDSRDGDEILVERIVTHNRSRHGYGLDASGAASVIVMGCDDQPVSPTWKLVAPAPVVEVKKPRVLSLHASGHAPGDEVRAIESNGEATRWIVNEDRCTARPMTDEEAAERDALVTVTCATCSNEFKAPDPTRPRVTSEGVTIGIVPGPLYCSAGCRKVADGRRALEREIAALIAACPADLDARAWTSAVLAGEEAKSIDEQKNPTQPRSPRPARAMVAAALENVIRNGWVTDIDVAAWAAYRRTLEAPSSPKGPWQGRPRSGRWDMARSRS